MAIKYIPPEDHLVRYVPWSKLRKDENDNVVGILGAAFKLRETEDYLSATWLEFFAGTRSDSIRAAVHTIRNSDIDVRPRSGFAIGNVSRIEAVCLADPRKYKIRFVHEEEPDNKAHVALRGWPRDNDALLERLAEEAWAEVVLNRNVG